MLDRNPDRGWLPLTLAQLDFWEEFCFHPDKPVSTVAHCVTLSGAVDADALAKAITRTVQEADILSVRFHCPPGQAEPVQRCDPGLAPTLRHIDLRAEPDPAAAAQALMQADIAATLDLHQQPLSAHWLLRLDDARWLWYARGHHIILDGYSMALLEQRCARLYAHFLGHGDAGAGFRPFAEYLTEEVAYQQSPRFGTDRGFWTSYLDVPVALPVLQKGGEDYGSEGLHGAVTFGADVSRHLAAMAAGTGIGWPDLLTLLAGVYLWHRLPATPPDTGQVLPIWLPYMSRMGSVSASIPALVVNILPALVQIGAEDTLGGYLARMAKVLRLQRRHGRYRVELLAADQGIGKGQRFFFSPLVNVLPFDPPVFHGCTIQRELLASGPGDGFNITFCADGMGGDLLVNLDADRALTTPRAFAAHLRDLPAFLHAALAPGGLPLPLAGFFPRHPPLSTVVSAAVPD